MIDEVMFMRHGRTAFNLQRRLQGQIDIPLDIVGQWQVDMSGFTLAQRFYWAKVSNIARHPDRKSTRLNSSHVALSRMPSSA